MTKKEKIKKTRRESVYDLFEGHCAYCGCKLSFSELTIDHKVPKWHRLTDKQCKHGNIIRGTDDVHNLFPSCKRCNTRKATFDIEQFREEIRLSTTRMMNNVGNYKIALDYGLIQEIKDANDNFEVEFYFEKYLKQKQNEQAGT